MPREKEQPSPTHQTNAIELSNSWQSNLRLGTANGHVYRLCGMVLSKFNLKVSDLDFTITLHAYFMVKWKDARLIVEEKR